MYRCELCGQLTRPGQPAHKVVTETRERSYLPPQESTPTRRGGRSRRSRRPARASDGVGREIVTERLVCSACADSHQPEE